MRSPCSNLLSSLDRISLRTAGWPQIPDPPAQPQLMRSAGTRRYALFLAPILVGSYTSGFWVPNEAICAQSSLCNTSFLSNLIAFDFLIHFIVPSSSRWSASITSRCALGFLHDNTRWILRPSLISPCSMVSTIFICVPWLPCANTDGRILFQSNWTVKRLTSRLIPQLGVKFASIAIIRSVLICLILWG